MSNEKKQEKEIRLANIANFNFEIRADEAASNKMIIEGYAAVYDEETLIGSEEWGFYERIEKGAFNGANMKDVPLRYNHCDGVPILARTRNKSLVLTPDEKGLHIRAELLDTQDNRDMYKRIQAGLVDKMSFAFTIAEEDWQKGKTPKRSIKKFDRIFDVSVVDTPAYEGTSIYARSLEFVETFKGTVDTEKGEKRNYTISNLLKQYKGVK